MTMDLVAAYDDILGRYASELAAARAEAVAWWTALVDREAAISATREIAEHNCRMRWPMGATSHPRVIAVYRKYFLEVGLLNEDYIEENESDEGPRFAPPSLWFDGVGDDDEGNMTEPSQLLLEGLDEVDSDLANFIRFLVFIPIGMDRDEVIR